MVCEAVGMLFPFDQLVTRYALDHRTPLAVRQLAKSAATRGFDLVQSSMLKEFDCDTLFRDLSSFQCPLLGNHGEGHAPLQAVHRESSTQ